MIFWRLLAARQSIECLTGMGTASLRELRVRGKLTVAEKIDALFVSGSFRELFPPAKTLDREHGERRIKTGIAKVDDHREIMVAIFDSAVRSGSVQIATGNKLLKLMDEAERLGLPLYIDWDCGGADINDGVDSLDIFTKIFTRLHRLQGVVPVFSAISGYSAGGAAYGPLLTDTVAMLRQRSMMAPTGPEVMIKVGGAEAGLNHDMLGGPRLHAVHSGEAAFIVDDYAHLARVLRNYIEYLPSNWRQFTERWSNVVEPDALPLAEIIRVSKAAELKGQFSPWDVRTFIHGTADRDSFMEYNELFAPEVVVGFARYGGFPLAMVANQRLVGGGALQANSSAKIRKFLQLANSFGLPVLTLVDVPGFVASSAASKQRILSDGASILKMYPDLTVPTISVVMDKAFGGAYCAMNSKDTSDQNPRSRHYALSSAAIAVMGPAAGIQFVYKDGRSVADRTLAYHADYMNIDRAVASGVVFPLDIANMRGQIISDLEQMVPEYEAWKVRALASMAELPEDVRRVAERGFRGVWPL